MATMGKYCRAYPITRFREYKGWTEKTENARKEKGAADGEEVEVERQLTDKDHLYLQESYVVTDGVFLDENIIFDDVTPEWKDFCAHALKFEVPVYETVKRRSAATRKSPQHRVADDGYGGKRLRFDKWLCHSRESGNPGEWAGFGYARLRGA